MIGCQARNTPIRPVDSMSLRALKAKNVSYALVLAGIIIVHICLLSTLRLYPMCDLPFHLAVATIHKHYGEASNHFAEYYSVDLFPKPNCFHPLFCGLRIFPGVETGNKVYYGIYLVLLPVSVLLIIRKVGGNPWISLLSLLLLYNLSFRWGFAGYTMAIPFIMLTLYFHLRSLGDPRPVWRVMVAAFLVGLHFMHVLAALLCALALLGSVLFHYRRSAAVLVRELLPLLPLVALVVWWVAWVSRSEGGALAGILTYYKEEFFPTISERGDLLHIDHRHLFAGFTGRLVGTLFSLVIVGPLLVGLVRNRRSFRRSLAKPELKSLMVFLAITLLCYLFLPSRVPGVVSIYRRLSVLVLAWSVVLLAVVYSGRLPRLAVIALCAVVLLHLALWGDYFREFRADTRSFARDLFPQDSRDKTLISLILDWKFRGAPIYLHFADYYVVWDLGITKSRFTQFKFVNVWPKKPQEWPPDGSEGLSDPSQQMRAYSSSDFILVRAAPGREPQSYLKGFDLKKRAGEWSLYEREPEDQARPP
jgi:hypothetical protein